jgi:hypothetical protein
MSSSSPLLRDFCGLGTLRLQGHVLTYNIKRILFWFKGSFYCLYRRIFFDILELLGCLDLLPCPGK